MKLLTFMRKGSPEEGARLGMLLSDGHTVMNAAAAHQAMRDAPSAALSDMLAFLDAGEPASDLARTLVAFVERERPRGVTHPVEAVSLLAPVPRPRSIRDCMAFERHVIQCMRAVARRRYPPLATLDAWLERWRGRGVLRPPKVWYERPVYYKGNPMSVVGHGAEVRWPSYTRRLDYELEFGIFVGKQGRNITEAEAGKHIAGYTIFNDFSARDVQGKEMSAQLGPSKGKDFDTGNAIGPYLVTPDEVPDPYGLTMMARVNGEEWSRGSSRDMAWTFEEMLAFISKDETLYPGEFIASGAVSGGCGLEIDRWLQPGDIVELEVDHLATLRNRIIRDSG